jgi:predicted component of type VI protein secretion system
MPKLTVFRGDAVVTTVDLDGRDFRVGRVADNDIVLPDEGKAVSRFHAELRQEGDSYVVLDLNSQNGTWVEGERVSRAALHPGSEIAIGPYRLVCEGGGAATAPEIKTPGVPVETAVHEVTTGTQRLRAAAAQKAVVAPKPAKRSSPAVKPAMAKGAAQKSNDPIARLARLPKPVLFGGFTMIALATMLLRPSEKPPETQPAAATATPAPAGGESTPPPADTNATVIANHLEEARKLEANKEYERALREHIDPVLLIEPRHTEALELSAKLRDASAKAVLEAAAATPTPAPVDPVVAPTPARPRPRVEPADPNALPRVAGESTADWQTRNAQLATDYEAALARVNANDWRNAIAQLENVAARHPTYRDVQVRLSDARASLAEATRAAFDLGKELEGKGDLSGALREFQRADTLGHANASGAAAAVAGRMRKEGQDAFTRARQYDALGRVPEAIALYERVVRYLPAGDANRKVAEERLARLRGGE